ncbi:MAG: 50S ribosomal protein L20, partial [Dehalococcoidales bacterium]|nr:50S ribosomal protein L20 [Dehalococcoidales bacterium]
MPRVKRGTTTHRRHKKVLALTRGHRASKHSLFRR